MPATSKRRGRGRRVDAANDETSEVLTNVCGFAWRCHGGPNWCATTRGWWVRRRAADKLYALDQGEGKPFVGDFRQVCEKLRRVLAMERNHG